MRKIEAWHFVGETLRDGRSVPKDGELLKVDGDPILCQRGLHASIHPFDALTYAPGPILCRVECGGVIVKASDKLVCTERRIIARADATEALWYFARMQALSRVDKWDAPDVVLDWLMTGAEDLRRAAASAAWSAAWSARYAAEFAAWSAAWSADESAAKSARYTARSAAWSAAEFAAWSAAKSARSAAWSAAREEWAQLVKEAFE